jgi:hypothetical protein
MRDFKARALWSIAYQSVNSAAQPRDAGHKLQSNKPEQQLKNKSIGAVLQTSIVYPLGCR